MRVIGLAAVIALLAGCSLLGGATYKSSDFTGQWKHVSGSHSSSLTLNSDGTFVVASVPLQVFPVNGQSPEAKPLDWSTTTTLHGSWEFRRDTEDIYLDITEGNRGAILLIRASGSTMRLSESLGDPDALIFFDFDRVR